MEEYDLESMRQQIMDCLDCVDDPGMLDLVYKLLASVAVDG